MKMEICRLYNKEAILQRSHIVPSSVFKSVKAGESQLYVFEEHTKPVYRNVDPKEKLLCRDCEQFLSVNYEQYGTAFTKNPKNVVKYKEHIEFKKFDYKKWYLYHLSILWRASISSLKEFSSIELGDFDQILRQCILANCLHLGGSLSLDDFITITMFRVIDKSSRIEDNAIKNIMLNPVRKGDNDDVLFFFMANGFLVQFRLNKNHIESLRYKTERRTDLDRNMQRFVRKVDITESAFLVDNFNWLIERVKS
ncbi:hypothetical protein BT047_RS21900 [Vibrio parahaemolyticus]|nr:hypothetical protein [Vibrio parahaemolyticus]EHR1263724.1 hypothetical protein [Vibrio parahaemolyticus]EJG1655596.1 hypothetical protein [Vibrio parahaemolyticus]EME0896162.1 hypothetical protein [Vibrio parahaemolyticus]